MGHDVHFLERMGRLARTQVDFALSLYRDPELVAHLLSRVELPEGAERVAIALDGSERPPHVVVATNGHFVTCLGSGMETKDLPVVTRARLDTAAGQMDRLRSRRAMAQEAETEESLAGLVGRLYEAGHELSREEFMAVARWQPILGPHLFAEMFRIAVDLDDTERLVVKMKRARRRDEELLRTYWNCLWAMGHLIVLAGMEGRGLTENYPSVQAEQWGVISWPILKRACLPLAFRAAWAVAAVGRPLLVPYKRRIEPDASDCALFDTILCLAAIGARHPRLRTQVLKALSPREPDKEEDPLGAATTQIVKAYGQIVEVGYKNPERMDQWALAVGRQLCLGVPAGEGKPSPFATAEDVPETIALAVLANAEGDYLSDTDTAATAVRITFRLARAKPEELYLPREYLETYLKPWKPACTLAAFERIRRADSSRVPYRAPTRHGRNDPCPCGSGKKHKHCCGG